MIHFLSVMPNHTPKTSVVTGSVTALEHCITTRGEAHRNEYCIHENSKLKKEEGKEAAKGVAHSKICRA
jgi:hypothetical protein